MNPTAIGAIRREALRKSILACTECPLHAVSSRRVPWSGAPSPVSIIGEAPGREEDLIGRPFVGAAGKLLDRLLAQAGIERWQVAFVNTICCRPPSNDYTKARDVGAVDSCDHWFKAQLRELGSWVLVAMGNSALSKFSDGSIGQHRGKPFWAQGFYIVPTYHPAYALRNPEAGATIIDDLQVVRKILIGELHLSPSTFPGASINWLRQNVPGHIERRQFLKQWPKGWVAVHSRWLNADLVITRDADTEVRDVRYASLPRYTVGEIERLSKTVRSADDLARVHWLKVNLGAEVRV